MTSRRTTPVGIGSNTVQAVFVMAIAAEIERNGMAAAGINERDERSERRRVVGSLSAFIVAAESRVTVPREPVSSEGRRRVREPLLGHTGGH